MICYYMHIRYAEGSDNMNFLAEKDIEEGKRLSMIFSELSEESKNKAIGYLSALRDKENYDSHKQPA